VRVLGLDPGLRLTGYACVTGDLIRPSLVEAGVFRLERAGRDLEPAESLAARLVELERDVLDLVERTRPDLAAVESMFSHPKHPGTVITMAHGRGVILLALRRAGVPIAQVRPAEVKKGLTGNGQAPKAQVQAAVQRLFDLPEPPSPPDVADAIAIAVAALRRAPV
jgi:crossover junction endodeoxyribonuclease RuvC